MTVAEHESVCLAIHHAQGALDKFCSLARPDANLEDLYQGAKPVHEAALGIWTTIVTILRAQHGLTKDPSDAINLEELFGEESTNG